MDLDKKIAIKERLIAQVGREDAEKIWARAKENLRKIETRYPDISKAERMHAEVIFPSAAIQMAVKEIKNGPDAGFKNVFYPRKKGEYKMDIVQCPYNRYFTELGTPELTKIFCINDECTYGDIPGLEF
ncbi:MAG: L-2-amino-thiazoline-4-carboxylic acid hydrolase, partial [Lachnospiraceae bacterium]|nr:L-2-amino-thiazoline-4-carboxylic acid hydrolase [Lachnospiraceae bacterium]